MEDLADNVRKTDNTILTAILYGKQIFHYTVERIAVLWTIQVNLVVRRNINKNSFLLNFEIKTLAEKKIMNSFQHSNTKQSLHDHVPVIWVRFHSACKTSVLAVFFSLCLPDSHLGKEEIMLALRFALSNGANMTNCRDKAKRTISGRWFVMLTARWWCEGTSPC